MSGRSGKGPAVREQGPGQAATAKRKPYNKMSRAERRAFKQENPELYAKARERARKKNKPSSLVFPVILLCMGLAGLGLPIVTDWVAAYHAENTISQMADAYEPLDDPERLALKANAEAYNASMGGYPYESEDYSGELLPYEQQMRFKQTVEMCWVNIPKITVRVPVYHGTSDEVLAAGVGHLDTSSLPVGGYTSLCALTGHSGMHDERMFDDIRRLGDGDIFVVHSLGEPYAYRVCETRVIEPQQVENLALQEGRDLCVLITCTPYGVNSHRLLVFGERVDYDPSMEPEQAPISAYVNSRTLPLIAALMLVFAVFAILMGLRRRRIRREIAKYLAKVGYGELDAAPAGNRAEGGSIGDEETVPVDVSGSGDGDPGGDSAGNAPDVAENGHDESGKREHVGFVQPEKNASRPRLELPEIGIGEPEGGGDGE